MEGFTQIAKAASSVALYTADQFPRALDVATPVWRKVSYIEQVIASRDLYTGRDRDDMQGQGLSFDL